MLVTICLISFGIYLGQEYPNLPIVKNIVFNLVSYVQQLQLQNSAQKQLNEYQDVKESSPLYLSFFRTVYNYFSKVGNSKNEKQNDLMSGMSKNEPDDMFMSDMSEMSNISAVFKKRSLNNDNDTDTTNTKNKKEVYSGSFTF